MRARPTFSNTSTSKPAQARRAAVVLPPTPHPTTIAFLLVRFSDMLWLMEACAL